MKLMFRMLPLIGLMAACAPLPMPEEEQTAEARVAATQPQPFQPNRQPLPAEPGQSVDLGV